VDEAARRVGIAWALLGLSRAVPFHARAGRSYLPRALAAQEGLAPDELASGQGRTALCRVVKIVVERAGDHLAAARATTGVPREALPALWPARLADLYRSRLARAGYDPFSPRLNAVPLSKQFRVLSGALTGRY
jgi:phytoene synthase